MRTWAKGTARATMLTASFVALGAGTVFPSGAFADTTSGDSSVLGGNQFNMPISAPMDASGNSLAALGEASGASKGGAMVANGRGGAGQKSSGNNGIGSGNQVNAPVSAPFNACGNAIAIFGTADAGCTGGAAVKGGGGRHGQRSSGNGGIGSGNQVNAPVSAPVNACGNAVAVFGSSEAGCEGGSKVMNGSTEHQTTGASGTVAGNQVNAPISTPVNICGNAGAGYGEAVAGCEGGAKVKNGGRTGAGQKSSGKGGYGAGNQVNTPYSAPINVCGNAAGTDAVADCDGGATVRNGGHRSGGQTTNGNGSYGGGNQVNSPASVPASACGNAAAMLGEAGAFCEGGAHVRSSSGGDQTTSGKGSYGGGNQFNVPRSFPENGCGNAVAALGDGAASCGGTSVTEGSHGSGATTSGNNGIGSGTQANVPGSGSGSACGNAVAALSHPETQCGDGPGWNGDDYYDHSRRRPGPEIGDSVGLPMLPDAAEALPMGLTSALPTLPQLPAKTPALSGKAPELSGKASELSGKAPALPGHAAQLPTGRSAVPETRAVPSPALPALPAAPKNAAKLPPMSTSGVAAKRVANHDRPAAGQLAGALPADPAAGLPADVTTALPADPAGALPAVPGNVTKALPKDVSGVEASQVPSTDLPVPGQLAGMLPIDPATVLPADPAKALAGTSALPARLPATSVDRAHARTASPVPATELPAIGQPQLPGLGKLPVTGDVKLPAVGGAQETLGSIQPVAAVEPVTSDTGSSIWVLAAAALLTAMSGAMGLTRRVRLGGRR
ncbi:chaplin family protein [Spirillospora sp. NPDC048911]|uniref:chaplin family protein n=1 Tax=Spirillospora sp. NPDC048911 TaxID=3364527 RepID=UPI003720607D